MTAQPKMILSAGGAELTVKFVTRPSEPLKDLAELRLNGRPYAEALSADVLNPFLARWTRRPGDRRTEIKTAVDAAMNQCVGAFRVCAPERALNEERAIMAALALTANLQRTLLHLGEILAQPRKRGMRRGTVVLSHSWCGLVPAPKRIVAPGAARLKPLVRALGYSAGEIDARCREALSALRKDFRRGGWIERADVEAAGRRFPT